MRLYLVLVLITISLIGCAIGNLIGEYLGSPAAVVWQSLGSPPEKAVKILGARIIDICVQSVTGKTYCRASAQMESWTETQPSLVSSMSGNTLFFAGTRIPDPPGKVVDSVTVDESAEMIERAKYAITEDGNVWMWRYTPSMFPSVEGMINGGFVGFLVGIVMSVFIWKKIGRPSNA